MSESPKALTGDEIRDQEEQVAAGAREDGKTPCHIPSNDMTILYEEINLDDPKCIRRLEALSYPERHDYCYFYLTLELEHPPGGLGKEQAFCEAFKRLARASPACRDTMEKLTIGEMRHLRIASHNVDADNLERRILLVNQWGLYNIAMTFVGTCLPWAASQATDAIRHVRLIIEQYKQPGNNLPKFGRDSEEFSVRFWHQFRDNELAWMELDPGMPIPDDYDD